MNEYRIHIPQPDLDDLAARVSGARFPSELSDAGWDYGIPVSRVRDLADKWGKFSWRDHEEALNSLPQFVTEIDGENVYLIHQRFLSPDAIPLILTHGWPGSVVEFLSLIPLLT